MRASSWLVLAALLLLAALAAAAAARGTAEARLVKLNSIRTLILRGDAHEHAVNRTKLPSLTSDLHQFYQCISDLECSEGSFCHAPSRRHAYSRCQTCRRRKRRCKRDAMCCPGNRCSNNMCVPDLDSFLSQRLSDEDGEAIKKKGGRKAAFKQSTIKGQVGDRCLRSSDCSESLCCARHFWARICKPVLMEGQVCTRGGPAGGPQQRGGRTKPPPHHRGLELFQRCDCARGLSCRALRHAAADTPPSSSSSTLLAAASKSLKLSSASHAAKVSGGSRHAAPHSSVLRAASALSPSAAAASSSSLSSSSPAKARLHLCQRN